MSVNIEALREQCEDESADTYIEVEVSYLLALIEELEELRWINAEREK